MLVNDGITILILKGNDKFYFLITKISQNRIHA